MAKSKGPKVPESVLKKRKRQDKWDAEKKAADVAAGKKAEEKKAEAFKRAEAYVKEFRDQEQQITTMKRAARKLGTFYVEPEPKLLFVMRLRGINGMHPKTRHIMKVLRLLQIHNGVFVQANKAVMNNLVKVDPYIMYGYPNLKTVKELIYKRGHAKIGKPPQRVPITDNAMIEDNLGEKTKGAVICIEDLITNPRWARTSRRHQVPLAVQDEQPRRRLLAHPQPLRRGRRRRQPRGVRQRADQADVVSMARAPRA